MTRTLMRYFGSHCETTDQLHCSALGNDVATYPSVSVKDVDVVAGVEVVDRTLAVNLERVCWYCELGSVR